MSLAGKLLDTFRKLSSLEARTEDLMRLHERIDVKLDSLIERLSRLEVGQEYLRETVRNEILADLKADLARTQVLFDNLSNSKRDSIRARVVSDVRGGD